MECEKILNTEILQINQHLYDHISVCTEHLISSSILHANHSSPETPLSQLKEALPRNEVELHNLTIIP
jgi:hypothetical protein